MEGGGKKRTTFKDLDSYKRLIQLKCGLRNRGQKLNSYPLPSPKELSLPRKGGFSPGCFSTSPIKCCCNDEPECRGNGVFLDSVFQTCRHLRFICWTCTCVSLESIMMADTNKQVNEKQDPAKIVTMSSCSALFMENKSFGKQDDLWKFPLIHLVENFFCDKTPTSTWSKQFLKNISCKQCVEVDYLSD